MTKEFSVVIPLAPDRSAEILSSLKRADYDEKKYEVIVVQGLNPSNNRNQGAAKSQGRIIAFLDDDAVVDPQIFNKALDFFNRHKDYDIVGGPQLTPKDEAGFALVSGYALSSVFGAWKMANRYVGKTQHLDADETMLTSANLFCRKSVFEKIKFDPELFPGEDPKFIEDARNAGIKVAYSPDIIIYHRRRDGPKKLAKQIFNYGKTRPKKESLLNTFKRPFFVMPSIFLIYLVLLAMILAYNTSLTGNIIGVARGAGVSWAIFLPLILYLFLDLVFSSFEAGKNRDLIAIPSLLFIFPLIHLSYGYGMIYSIMKKII